MDVGRIIATIVFVIIGGAIMGLGLIQRKNSDVKSKPSGLSQLFKPKQSSGKQGAAPATNRLIYLILLLAALFIYFLLGKR